MDYKWLKMPTFAGLLLFGAACGETTTTSDAPSTEDGVVKAVDGRADRWNWRNSPRHFRTEFDYVYENLPSEGSADRVAWAASYWPYYEGGINHRWQGSNVLSPAEKYDQAFNGWEAPEGFMQLEPWNSYTCEYDEAYYEQLGPAASWTDRNRGTWMAHNGVDDDGDGVEDADECTDGWGEYDGLETWWGICHAWGPAAILEPEPVEPVTRNGVTFAVSDLKALLIQQYDRTDSYMIGGRCNEEELERDETGRITRTECRDLNAGSWHVVVTNLLGDSSRPFIIERTTNYQVWNQPLVGYEITEQREITLEEAHDLLQVTLDDLDEGTGEEVYGIEEGTFLARAILDFVNTSTFEALDDDARLDRRAVENIFNARPIDSLGELSELGYVGESAFAELQSYVEVHDLVDAPEPEYVYNSDAERFIEVRMTTDWVTESHPSTEPRTPVNDRYTRHDHYHYILELDADGEIIGGEWVGESNMNHPDFVWLPVAARSGNPHLDLDTIRDMVRESREGLDDGGDDDGADGDDDHLKTYTSTEVLDIPDNDPEGATSVLSVSDGGTVKAVELDLEIDHTYRGDLVVELAKDGVVITVYDGSDASTPWEDDVTLEQHDVEGFLGANLAGDWELRIYDTMGYDLGNLVEWTLTVEID